MLYMYLMPEGKKMFGWQMLFVKIFVNFLSPLWHFFSMYLHKVENSTINSLFHTVKYKNHSVGYIFTLWDINPAL